MIRSNEFHTYFRVNSVFWDPNIYGRYLALVIVIAMAALLWAKERRSSGCSPAWSRCSGSGWCRPSRSRASPPCSPAWRCSPRCAGACAGRWPRSGSPLILGVLVVLLAGGVSKISPSRLNIDTSGRANLVSGGIDLFAQRPL